MYQPIWLELKEKHKARIAADSRMFRRIEKAVSKEHQIDLAFKYSLAESRSVAKIEFIRSKFELRMVLHIKPKDWIDRL